MFGTVWPRFQAEKSTLFSISIELCRHTLKQLSDSLSRKHKKLYGISRHGPEVPKFVFMAVCFETHCHAKSMAQLITISVGSSSTYILLKFKKLKLSTSQQDPNWARRLKMPPR